MKTEEVKLTPSESRLLEMLSDGEFHCIRDLTTCLPDYLTNWRRVKVLICQLRKKLPDDTMVLFTNRGRGYGYQMVKRYEK